MGYSIYWERNKHASINGEDWKQLTDRFASALPSLDVKLADGNGEGSEPLINSSFVALNGSRKLGEDYESFIFARRSDEHIFIDDAGMWFECTKTAQRPYTVACFLFLFLAKEYDSSLIISFDGDESDPQYQEAKRIYESTF